MRVNTFLLLTALAGLLAGCTSRSDRNEDQESAAADGSEPAITDYSKTLPLDSINLPDGFTIDIYAEVDNARSLAISPSGTVYVGNRNGDAVYAVRDSDGDNVADKKWTIAKGLNSPNGVAFNDGSLYVAEISTILKFANIENNLSDPGTADTIASDFPTESHHGWKYIAFGPDGKLYVPVGAPCNICEPKEEIFASITRMNADGSGREIFARGVRNTVGFTWHPETNELWFTDNGRDAMGDDIPDCELNHAPQKGMHFGYPYCHAGTVKDPEFGGDRDCNEFVPPVRKLGPHVAPLGLKFYTGEMFPSSYRNQVIVARHGSWNRSKKSGHDLSLVRMEGDKATGQEVFASGWLDDETQKVWGRPVDVLVMPDGSLLVSDDQASVIYRISYQG